MLWLNWLSLQEGISVEEVKKFQRSLVLPPGQYLWRKSWIDNAAKPWICRLTTFNWTHVNTSHVQATLSNKTSIYRISILTHVAFESPSKNNAWRYHPFTCHPELKCCHLRRGSGSYHCKQYAKAIFKYVTARGLRGKWGGNRKRHAPSSTPCLVTTISFGMPCVTWRFGAWFS